MLNIWHTSTAFLQVELCEISTHLIQKNDMVIIKVVTVVKKMLVLPYMLVLISVFLSLSLGILVPCPLLNQLYKAV